MKGDAPTMVNNSLFAVAIDCADAAALARFWADVLGRQIAEGCTAERAVLLTSSRDTCEPCFVFNKVPEAKIVKNRLHLDLISDTFDGESERLLEPGRSQARRPAVGECSLDDLRRHRRQQVRLDRRVALQAMTAAQRAAAAGLTVDSDLGDLPSTLLFQG